MNANLVHKWLRDPRFAPEEEIGEVLDAIEAAFLPLETADAVPIPSSFDMRSSTPTLTEPVSAPRVDITLSDGRRILVEGTTSLLAVLPLAPQMFVGLVNPRNVLPDIDDGYNGALDDGLQDFFRVCRKIGGDIRAYHLPKNM